MEFCRFLRSVKFVVRSLGRFLGPKPYSSYNHQGKGSYFTRVARDSSTRLINLWPSVHTSCPP